MFWGIEEGKGHEAKFGDTIYYNIESRYEEGTLCNPRSDRRGINKLSLNIKELSDAGFVYGLIGTKFGECFWCKITGKLMEALAYYKSLPITEVPKDCQRKELWCKFTILRIKHAFPKIYCDFNTLKSCIEESKTIAKNYLDLSKFDETLYDYGLELYKFWLSSFKCLTKQIKKGMTPDSYNELNTIKVMLNLNIAFVYLNKNDFTNAKTAAEAALEIDPNNLKGNFRLAQACIEDKRLKEKTYESLKFCFSKEPNNPSFKPYKDWFDNYNGIRTEKKKKDDPWNRYKKILDNEEFDEKAKRKFHRTGKYEEKKSEVCNESSEPVIDFDSDLPDDAEEIAKQWEEVLNQDEEEKAKLKMEEKKTNENVINEPVITEEENNKNICPKNES